jgi:hypothetical protein
MRSNLFIRRLVDVAVVLVVLLGYFVFFWISRALWQVRAGSEIQPMGISVGLFVVALATPIGALVVSNFAPDDPEPARRRLRVFDIAMMVAALALIMLAFVYIPFVARLRGLRLIG